MTSSEVQTQVVTVPLRREVDETYPIVIGNSLCAAVVDRLSAPDLVHHRPVIITDDTVRNGPAEDVRSELERRGTRALVVSFPPGEAHKTRATKAELEDTLIEAGCGRDTCIIAVGGGVVTDLAGFVAATFTRGVPLLNVPTTILAAADASVGGKTGIDTEHATNLIGAFHQPVGVFIDLSSWRTLPPTQISAGLAETIKHACIADEHLFALLEQAFVHDGRSLGDFVGDLDLCAVVARRNCEIKRDFVAADVHEANVRMALNLGHTFGRALEAAEDFRLSHGDAVAIGLCLQAQWGQELGFVTSDDVDRVRRLLRAVGLPTELPAHTSTRVLVAKMALDKKVRANAVGFVFQKRIGAFEVFDRGQVVRTADATEITAFLERARR